jgi:hypothetical protein
VLPGPALSKARARSGEHVARRAFELDAARAGAELGTGQLWHGLEVTAFDGTTAALDANDELDAAFGVPAGGKNPMLRIVALVRTATHRWAAAIIGGYHDGENALVDQLESALAAGTLNLADRGFFSMDRFLRFSATGAQLCWRVKNGAKSVPVKTLETLPDGSELVMLHESDGMRARAPPRYGRQDRGPAPGHDRPAGPVHHRDPHPRRTRQDQHHPAADHPAGPREAPGRGNRRSLC